MVYQGSPLGATVIPNGPLPLTALPSVTTPALVILAALPKVSWVNHTVPSGEAAMPEGPVLLVPGALTSPGWVNQALPPTSTATSAGSETGNDVKCPSERW